MPGDETRFYLDENVPAAVADQLRRRGIDVVRCQEAGLRSAADLDHLEEATQQRRVLVTFDKDFLRLNADGRVHAGIAFVTEPMNIGAIVRSLLELHAKRTPEQMTNRVWYI